MKNQDIRWIQRFNNFLKAFSHLESAIKKLQEQVLSDLEEQGLIQRFEFTHELAWKVIKDYFEYQGNTNITGSRDATRQAFKNGLITDGDGWMEMINSRNMSSHTYNEDISKEIVKNITQRYFDLFVAFKEKMETFIEE